MKEKADGDGLSVEGAIDATLEANKGPLLKAISVLNAKEMPEFSRKLKDFSDRLLETETPEKTIRQAFENAQCYGRLGRGAGDGSMPSTI